MREQFHNFNIKKRLFVNLWMAQPRPKDVVLLSKTELVVFRFISILFFGLQIAVCCDPFEKCKCDGTRNPCFAFMRQLFRQLCAGCKLTLSVAGEYPLRGWPLQYSQAGMRFSLHDVYAVRADTRVSSPTLLSGFRQNLELVFSQRVYSAGKT